MGENVLICVAYGFVCPRIGKKEDGNKYIIWMLKITSTVIKSNIFLDYYFSLMILLHVQRVASKEQFEISSCI